MVKNTLLNNFRMKNFRPSEFTCSAQDFKTAEMAVASSNLNELRQQVQENLDNVMFASRLKIAEIMVDLAAEFALDPRDPEIGRKILEKMKGDDEFTPYYATALAVEKILDNEESKIHRELINYSSDVLWKVNLRTMCFSYASPSILKMGGYTQEEILSVQLNECITPESFPAAMEAIATGVANHKVGRGEPQVIELKMVRKDRSTMWAQVHAQHIMDEQGEPAELQGITHDITEKKKNMLALEEAHRNLQLKQDELIRAARLAGLGVLAAGVAHDFNNILHGISMNIEVLSEDARSLGAAETDEIMLEIKQLLKRAGRLANDLLILAREKDQKNELVFLPKVIDDGIGFLERQFMSQGIAIEKDYQADFSYILADAGQLKDVITNLAINALHAMESFIAKKRKLSDNPSMTFKLGCRAVNDSVEISVSDTGGGIPPDIRPNIFDPFFTTKAHTSKEGTGLGLAITHAIIERHGGKITMNSMTEEEIAQNTEYANRKPGTTFKIFLPRQASMRKNLSSRPPEQMEILHPNSLIYIVDDEPTILKAIKRALSKDYVNIQVFNNGQAVLDQMKEENECPALIVSDIQMPVLDGESLCREMLKIDEGIRPLFIVMTGKGTEVNRKPFFSLGVLAVISKPFVTDDLRSVISDALNNQSALRRYEVAPISTLSRRVSLNPVYTGHTLRSDVPPDGDGGDLDNDG